MWHVCKKVISHWGVWLLMSAHVFANDTALYDALREPVSDENMKSSPEPIERFTLWDNDGRDYAPQFINVNETLPYRYRTVIEDSIYLQGVMLSSLAVLALMPESITNWNAAKLEEKSLSQRWKEHVSTAPVWDNDSWVINYIGHPVSGAWYYTMARNDGLTIGESAAVSALMSTFFWEYGYEAFAEVPSIQDLIFTPFFGSLFGEGMYVLQGKLDDRGGVLWGSKTLGNVSYFLIDPLGNIADWMKNGLKQLHIDADVTMTIQTYPNPGRRVQPSLTDTRAELPVYHEREYGFIIRFQ